MTNPFPSWNKRICRETIRYCFPKVHIRTLSAIHGGWDNFVVDVNDRLLFRFPRRVAVEASIEKEIALLRLLQRALPYSIPNPEYVWSGDRKVPIRFYGYPKIRGVPLTHEAIASSQASFASQVSRLLNLIQNPSLTHAARNCFARYPAQTWRGEYASLLSRVRKKVVRLLDAGAREKTLAIFDDFLDDRDNFSFAPVLVHRDLNSNILYDERRREISGVIDWGDAAMGDPAFDFCGFLHSEGRGFVESVLRDYRGQVDESFWGRMEFYSKAIPYHVILGAMITGRPYRIVDNEVIVGRGPTVAVFKMFKSSSAFEIRGPSRSHR